MKCIPKRVNKIEILTSLAFGCKLKSTLDAWLFLENIGIREKDWVVLLLEAVVVVVVLGLWLVYDLIDLQEWDDKRETCVWLNAKALNNQQEQNDRTLKR